MDQIINLKGKSLFPILSLLVLCFVLAACTNKTSEKESNTLNEISTGDGNLSAITAVLEKEFNGPDKEYLRITNDIEENMIKDDVQTYEDGAPELAVYEDYLEMTYGEYFTENGYSSFKPFAFYYHSTNDYKMKTENIEIDQSSTNKDYYSFVVQVNYQNDSETKEYEITGSAICPEEGKIGKISFDVNEDMTEQIMNKPN
ncbi:MULTISPECIES: hypothetical protein [Planococcus]|uniref:Lipoprotein n=1 Tax=Planococcus versutus TaxID=1302659 RepID=A0A1B1RXZ7_9BACL|nr:MULTISPECIES: hypothetical protein [Planococcus]ANU25821.1 hypothetical protein I858_001860 [Planococcus versutus]MDJ0333538.1 hypothetical protein [Planococcus sp. S3-L1]